MRETAGKQEMEKLRRNEYCESAGSGGRFPSFYCPFLGVFFSNSLYDLIIIIMPGSGYYGLAPFNELSNLEGLVYEYVLRSEYILYF